MLCSTYVCGEKGANITMCPLCDKVCNYWKLKDNCLYARITYLFDNNFAVVFAFLMSVWGKLVVYFFIYLPNTIIASICDRSYFNNNEVVAFS